MPASIVKFIRENTVSYGKVKLLLRQNRYFIESSYPETLQVLLKDPEVTNAIKMSNEMEVSTSVQKSGNTEEGPEGGETEVARAEDKVTLDMRLTEEDDNDEKEETISVEVIPGEVEVCYFLF